MARKDLEMGFNDKDIYGRVREWRHLYDAKIWKKHSLAAQTAQ